MLFNIYNVRMLKVGWVDAVDAADALQHAKRQYPGASVERVLTLAEQRQRDYHEQEKIWTAVNRMYHTS